MSGLVGSTPSLSRSGRPSSSCSASLPAGSTSTAPASSWARVVGRSRRLGCGGDTGPMLDSPRRLERGLPPLFRCGPDAPRWVLGRPCTAAGDDRRLTSGETGSPTTSEPSARSLRHGLRTRTRPRQRRRGRSRVRRRRQRARRAPAAPRGRRRAMRRAARGAATCSPSRPGPTSRRSATRPRLRKLRFALVVLGLSAARLRLLDLRDHDGGRPGPALAREPRAVQAGRELGRLRRLRQQAGDADQQPGPGVRRPPTRSPR